MARRCLLVLVLAACGGSHHAPDAGMIDGAPFTVTGRDVIRDVRCTDATRVPSVADVPYQSLTGSLIGSDGAATPLEIAADGTFSFPSITGAPFRVALTGDGGTTIEYQVATSKLEIGGRLAGRYPRTPVPSGTTLSTSISGSVPGGGAAAIMSVGLWTDVFRPSGNNAAFTVPWDQTVSVSGPAALLDANAFDRGFWTILDFSGASPQYTAITTACSEDFTMIAGTSNVLTCTAAPVTFDHCVHVTTHAAAEGMRLAAAAPASYTTPSYSWSLIAVPAPALASTGGLPVAYFNAGNQTPADSDRDVMFGVPFTGHDVALQMTLLRGRTVALDGAQATTINALTTHVVKPADDCSTPTVVDGTVAIPTQPGLDGVGLASDGVEVALDRTQPHVLTWDVAAPGTQDYWLVRLFELTAPAGQTELTARSVWVSDHPSIAVDAARFTKGSTYLFEIEAVSGYPGAAQGNFYDLAYPASPYAVSSILSGTFVVDN